MSCHLAYLSTSPQINKRSERRGLPGKAIARLWAMKAALKTLKIRFLLRTVAYVGLLVGVSATQFEANATLSPSASEIHDTLLSNFKCLKAETSFKFEVGVTQFVPLSLIKASQPGFTAIKLVDELREAVDRYGVEMTEKGPVLRDGRSVYPPHKKAFGVVYDGRVYLLDGHHKALISLYFNAHSMPVEIIADWTRNSSGKLRTEAEFREKMTDPKNAYAYPFDSEGAPTSQFFDLCDLRDDPNLYLARLLIQKVKATVSLESLQVREVSGSDHPLILKLNEGVPFLEFYIAATLSREGITYEREWRKDIPDKVRTQIRKALQEEVERDNSPLRRIILLDDYANLPTEERSLDRKRMKIIYKHLLNRLECDDLLGSPPLRNQE